MFMITTKKFFIKVDETQYLKTLVKSFEFLFEKNSIVWLGSRFERGLWSLSPLFP